MNDMFFAVNDRFCFLFLAMAACPFGVAACAGPSIFDAIGTQVANPLTVTVNATTQRAYINNSNNKFLFTQGSVHIVDLTTLTAPTRLASMTTDSYNGHLFLDTVNQRLLAPNRLSDDDLDTTDRLFSIDVNEASATFQTVTSVDMAGNPFGVAQDTVSNRLFAPTREGTLDVFDLAATPISRTLSVDLKRTLSDGTTLASAPAAEIAVANAGTQAVVTRTNGGIMVINLSELASASANPVDYLVLDFDGPRGIATDGTLVYVVDIDGETSATAGFLRVLDLSNLPADSANTTTALKDKDTDSVQLAAIAVGNNAQEVVVSTSVNRAYVTNLDDDTVSVIDLATRTKLADIAVGDEPFGMALYQSTAGGADTHLLVCNQQSSTVSIIDLATNSIIATYQ